MQWLKILRKFGSITSTYHKSPILFCRYLSYLKSYRNVSVFKRGCCIRSPLVTKLFEVVVLHEDITQRDLKNSSHWCTCDLSPHRVLAMSVHYFWRYEHFSECHFYFLALRFCSYLCKWSSWARPAEYYINRIVITILDRNRFVFQIYRWISVFRR